MAANNIAYVGRYLRKTNLQFKCYGILHLLEIIILRRITKAEANLSIGNILN